MKKFVPLGSLGSLLFLTVFFFHGCASPRRWSTIREETQEKIRHVKTPYKDYWAGPESGNRGQEVEKLRSREVQPSAVGRRSSAVRNREAGIKRVKDVPDQALQKSPLELNVLILYALEHNPKILALKAKVVAAYARIPQAESLEDPQLSLDFSSLYRGLVTGGSAFMAIGISQLFPSRKTLPLEGEKAGREARQTYDQLAMAVLDLVTQIKVVYYHLQKLHHALSITDYQRHLLTQIEKTAQVKYSVGEVSQQDALRAEGERATVENNYRVFKEMVKGAQAQLNFLLGRTPESALGEIPSFGQVPSPADFKPLHTLYRLALQTFPELKEAQEKIREKELDVQLVQKKYSPNWTPRLAYVNQTMDPFMKRTGQKSLSPALMLNLPVWKNKLEGRLAETIAEETAEKEQYREIQLQLLSQVKTDYVDSHIASFWVDLSRHTLIPLARQTLTINTIQYQTGTTDFTTLLDSEKWLFDLILGYDQNVATFFQKSAELDRLVTFELFRKNSKEHQYTQRK